MPSDPDGEVDLCYVSLATPDPESSARRWLELGFEPEPRSARGVTRVRLGDDLPRAPRSDPPRRPSARSSTTSVCSSSRSTTSSHERLDVVRTVDAENSRAVFVKGPDGVEVEFIEHKPSFALA